MRTLREALEQSRHLVWLADAEGRRLDLSRGWREFTGLAPEGDPEDQMQAGIHPVDRAGALVRVHEAVISREEVAHEYRLRRHDGQFCRMRELICTCLGEDGKVVGFVGTCREAADAEPGRAWDRQELFETVLDEIPLGVCLLSSEGTVIEINRSLRRLLGYAQPDLVGQDLAALVHPDSRDALNAEIERVSEGAAGSFTLEVLMLFSRNRSLWTRICGRRLTSDDERTPLICSVEDISSVRHVEERLRDEVEFSTGLVNSMPGVFYLFNELGRFVRWNANLESVSGYSAAEIAERHPLEFFGEEDRKAVEAAIANVFSEGAATVEASLATRNGTRIPYLFNGLRVTIGNASYLSGLGIDITRRKVAEQTLLRVNENLEKAVAERTREAEERSRQLRFLTTQLTQTEQRERRQLAQRLHDDLQQHLVNAKIKLSMTGHRHPDARRELIDLDLALNEALSASRSLTLDLSPPVLYDAGLSAGMAWLARRFEQGHNLRTVYLGPDDFDVEDEDVRAFLFTAARELLLNVVNHAGVSEAWLQVEPLEKGRVRVTVRDQGKGFDPSSELVADRGHLGLFSLRERLECLGGSMKIESVPGEGAVVSLEVTSRGESATAESVSASLAPAAASENGASKIKENGKIRVMLADDHKMLRDGLAGLIGEEPDMVVVAEASDGLMALQLAREFRPNVVIMDISMPRMNGIEATRQLTREFPEIQVVGLSMHEREDMAAAMRKAGARDLITKGAASELLIEAVRVYAGRPSG